jgi:uncharacterized membrane protein
MTILYQSYIYKEAMSKLNLDDDVIHIGIVVLYAFETLAVTDWWWFITACCG